MLRSEARWLRREMARLSVAQLDPVLSIGSGDEVCRNRVQPWIAEEVFDPLVARGVDIVHHEHFPSQGVDVAGDLADPDVLASLRALQPRTILCCSVLEHVVDPTAISQWMSDAISPGGTLVVTVPRRFPYHPDPIDSLYRPSLSELESTFPDLTLRFGAEVPCGTLLEYFLIAPHKVRRVGRGLRELLRSPSGNVSTPPRDDSGAPAVRRVAATEYLFRETSMTCAVFERCA
jgi:hypothetical protein